MKKVCLTLLLGCFTLMNAYSQTCTIDLTSAIGTDAQTVCEGDPITDITCTVSGTGATVSSLPSGISGSFAAGVFTIAGTPTIAGTTNFTVTTTGGCTPDGIVTGSITVNAAPTVSVDNQTICEGSTATLTANGATSYVWSEGSATSSITVSPVASTTYSVTGTTDGCSAQAEGTVTIKSTPVITVNSPIICEGMTATITARGGGSYIWLNDTTFTNPHSFTPKATMKDSVFASSAVCPDRSDINVFFSCFTSGCTNLAWSSVTVTPIPVITVNAATICIGDSATLSAAGGAFYNWETGETGNSIIVSPTTTTTYSVSDNTPGCSGSATTTVTVMPLKNPNKPGVCGVVYTISGNVYQDQNSNCVMDSLDLNIDNIPLKLYNVNNYLIGQTYTRFGAYTFSIWDSTGTYTVKIDSSSLYSSQCGSGNTHTVSLSTLSPQVENLNFSRKCSSDIDYGIRSVSPRGRVFPGQTHSLNIYAGIQNSWFKLDCPETNSGTLIVTVTGPVTYNRIYPGALTPTINGNEYSYTIADWSTINMYNDFKLYFDTKTTAQSGDEICIHAELTTATSDNNITNNSYDFCYRIRNSYDPNLKEVYPIDVEPAFEDWLSYTIHFQNTGDANAIDIRLEDTLDANLNLETFEVLGYSHPCAVTLYENLLTIFYANIELPDSASNPEGSQGSFQYRIKPVSNLPLGTKINNTASIYFDYNAPIVTNTTVNEYKSITNISGNNRAQFVRIFPNPFDASLQIELDKAANISIRNLLGSVVYSGSLAAGTSTIETSSLCAGIYFISIENGEGVSTEKLIKN